MSIHVCDIMIKETEKKEQRYMSDIVIYFIFGNVIYSLGILKVGCLFVFYVERVLTILLILVNYSQTK